METIIQKTLQILLDKFGAEYDVVMVTEDSGHYRANIETTDPSRLIGKNGATLNALEMFLKIVLHKGKEERIFLTVDVDNYKKSREDLILEKVAGKIEDMREQNLGEIKLWPMRAGLRKLLHLWVDKNYSDLTTDSIGEGRSRSIKILRK